MFWFLCWLLILIQLASDYPFLLPAQTPGFIPDSVSACCSCYHASVAKPCLWLDYASACHLCLICLSVTNPAHLTLLLAPQACYSSFKSSSAPPGPCFLFMHPQSIQPSLPACLLSHLPATSLTTSGPWARAERETFLYMSGSPTRYVTLPFSHKEVCNKGCEFSAHSNSSLLGEELVIKPKIVMGKTKELVQSTEKLTEH